MNVVLTGASRGIGYQTALNLSQAGVKNLVLVARDLQALEVLMNECHSIHSESNVKIISADISTLELDSDREFFIQQIGLDKIDVLINNAGLLINKQFLEFNTEEAQQVFNVNFHAPANLIKMVIPFLKKSEKAHVVNISSISGFQGSSKYPGLTYYSASKAALASLTECLASEYAETNIKFNCLALGAVQTEMLAEAFPGYQAPLKAEQMGKYIADFALSGHNYYNGQILPVRLENP